LLEAEAAVAALTSPTRDIGGIDERAVRADPTTIHAIQARLHGLLEQWRRLDDGVAIKLRSHSSSI